MTSTSLKRVGLLAAATIFVGFIGYTLWDPNEPRYKGVRLTAWLRDYDVPSEPSDARPRPEAEKALQEIGPSAAPYIIRELKADDSSLKRYYRAIFPKIPSWLRKILGNPNGLFVAGSGARAFLAIGGSAKPTLIKALKDESATVRSAAAQAAFGIGRYRGADLHDALPILIESLKDSDANVRIWSVSAIGTLGPDAHAAVPGLIPLLSDPETGRQPGSRVFVRSATARVLGKIGPDAKNAIPSLKTLLADSEAYNRSLAAIALWRIDSDVTNTLPVLIQGLSQLDAHWELVEALTEMGSRAKDAFPALAEQLNQKPQPDDWMITNALLHIDPEAAAKAGIK